MAGNFLTSTPVVKSRKIQHLNFPTDAHSLGIYVKLFSQQDTLELSHAFNKILHLNCILYNWINYSMDISYIYRFIMFDLLVQNLNNFTPEINALKPLQSSSLGVRRLILPLT